MVGEKDCLPRGQSARGGGGGNDRHATRGGDGVHGAHTTRGARGAGWHALHAKAPTCSSVSSGPCMSSGRPSLSHAFHLGPSDVCLPSAGHGGSDDSHATARADRTHGRPRGNRRRRPPVVRSWPANSVYRAPAAAAGPCSSRARPCSRRRPLQAALLVRGPPLVRP